MYGGQFPIRPALNPMQNAWNFVKSNYLHLHILTTTASKMAISYGQ